LATEQLWAAIFIQDPGAIAKFFKSLTAVHCCLGAIYQALVLKLRSARSPDIDVLLLFGGTMQVVSSKPWLPSIVGIAGPFLM
jgi:hypothetical protein